MDYRVLFQPAGIEISVPTGTTLSAAARSAGLWIDSPCGGNGTCGKCEVSVVSNGQSRRALACQSRVEADCVVTLPDRMDTFALSNGSAHAVKFEPYHTPASSDDGACFACFDLGTTTIVCYLLDAKDGSQIAVAARQNPQTAYGADVMTRANHALAAGSSNELKHCVTAALNELIQTAVKQTDRSAQQVALISIVGNTVMLHLLLGYPLMQLVCAPYHAHSTQRLVLSAGELSINAHPNAKALIAPAIGGFVGADTVACLSATEFDRIAAPALLIDIGTNGELALTDGTRRVCCSTAAGPAFEGANISCGMRAERGAVDHVWIDAGELRYSTIGQSPARGICGSGLIELVAMLLSVGAVEESGRFAAESPLNRQFVSLDDGSRAFLVAEGERRVTLSQKDVRELQLGKAAIRAGIEVLLDTLSLRADQVERVLLAGAFGAHLSPEALCGIGLFPAEFSTHVQSVGNAAGEGAKLYARNFAQFDESEPLARGTEYIELTVSPAFTKYYIDAMAFPEPIHKEGGFA